MEEIHSSNKSGESTGELSAAGDNLNFKSALIFFKTPQLQPWAEPERHISQI